MQSECFFGAFFQTSGGTRIEIPQLAQETVWFLFRGGVIEHGIGVAHLRADVRLVVLAEMVHHIADLMDLATLDQCIFSYY